jgi:2-dehydropantoate 2-reductase
VAVIGAGAIAAVVTAALLDAGHAPTVCVRTPIPSLRIESEGGERVLSAATVADPAEVCRTDWVLITTKAQDTVSAAPWLRALCGPETTVVALQNGIDHAARLAPFVGGATVLPALVYIAAERIGPGWIVHHSGRRVVVPAGVAGASFAHLLRGRLEVVEEPDHITAEWRKLLSNVVANPLTTLTMRRVDVMNDPGVEEFGRALMGEAVAVAQAEGAAVGQADIDEIFARYRTLRDGSSHGSSMYYDRLAGLPLEHEELTGALVRVARRCGIPTPLNDSILALLRALDRGRAGLDG